MFNRRVTKVVAAVAAAVAVAIGGLAIGNSTSSNGSSGTANAAQAPQSGQPHQPSTATVKGQVPANWQPGTGTIITGSAADKAKAVAIDAGYKGTVNRVLQLSDGSYVVHIIANPNGPHHVFVSKDFKVMGSE
jgi:hypothetical protein